MKFFLRFGFLFGFCALVGNYILCPEVSAQNAIEQSTWPESFSATFGFELIADHQGSIIVFSVDSTSRTYQLGVRPGMELLGWNTLPLQRKLESMKVRKYRKSFPGMTDQKLKLMLITRGRPGDKAEAFFLTETGNNRGIRLTAQ